MPSVEEIQKNQLRKVAVLLTLIGEEAAQAIVKQFDPNMMERLGKEMARCQEIERQEQELVLKDFVGALQTHSATVEGGISYVEKVFSSAMEPDKAQRVLKKIRSPRQLVPFEELQEISPEQLLEIIQEEHPQTIALVIGNLPAETAAKLIGKLPAPLQKVVAERIAVLDQNTPDLAIVHEIEARLLERLKGVAEKTELAKFGGARACADILTLLDKTMVRDILDDMNNTNQEAATAVKQNMVRFEDLLKLTDMEVQRVLKEVETSDLSMACVRLDKSVAEKIFHNMSQRGAEMLKEDIEVMENTKNDVVRAARIKMAEVMRRLDDDGSIVINKRSMDDETI